VSEPSIEKPLHLQKLIDEDFFFHGLRRPKTLAELEALILQVSDHSPGNRSRSVFIQLDQHNELVDAADFVNACQRQVLEFCRADPTLPTPPSLEAARSEGVITVLGDLATWCRRAVQVGGSVKEGGSDSVAPDTNRVEDEPIAPVLLPKTDAGLELWRKLEGVALSAKELSNALDGKPSESAVMKRIKKLRDSGFEVLQRPGRGYYRPDNPPSD